MNKKPIIFYHLAKVAGTTLRHAIYTHLACHPSEAIWFYRDPGVKPNAKSTPVINGEQANQQLTKMPAVEKKNIKFITGHVFGNKVFKHFDNPVGLIAMRDPWSWVLSWRYQAQNIVQRLHPKTCNLSLPEFIEAKIQNPVTGIIANMFMKNKDESLVQTDSENDLNLAKQALDEYLIPIHHGYIDRDLAKFFDLYNVKYTTVNVGSRNPRRQKVPVIMPEEQERLSKKYLAMDYELFEYSKQLKAKILGLQTD